MWTVFLPSAINLCTYVYTIVNEIKSFTRYFKKYNKTKVIDRIVDQEKQFMSEKNHIVSFFF